VSALKVVVAVVAMGMVSAVVVVAMSMVAKVDVGGSNDGC
jgi:hypothetical protein